MCLPRQLYHARLLFLRSVIETSDRLEGPFFATHKLKEDENRSNKSRSDNSASSSTQNYTMKNLQTIVVLGLFALVSAKKLPKIPPPREGSVRRAKKGKNSNNDGDRDRSGGYDSCIPLDTVPPGIISATTGRDPNDECLTENKCNTGCCRVYNWLQCDEDNEYYWLEVRRVKPTSIVY